MIASTHALCPFLAILTHIRSVICDVTFFLADLALFLLAAAFPFLRILRVTTFDSLIFFALIEIALTTFLIQITLISTDVSSILVDVTLFAANLTVIRPTRISRRSSLRQDRNGNGGQQRGYEQFAFHD